MALYHSAKGSLNYAVVGNPTIVDGVASGFSNSNYLSITQGYSYQDIPTIEMQAKFTTGNTLGDVTNQELIAFLQGASTSKLRLLLFGKVNLGVYYAGMNIVLDYAVSTNTTYIAKASITNQEVVVSLFNENGILIDTKTQSITASDDLKTLWKANLGALGFGSTSYLTGSIDLNNTYIKVNGQPWFGVCPVEVKKHQLMGPVGYTVVGSPTIADGVASGLVNRVDYIQIPQLPNDINSFEFVIKVSPKIDSRCLLFYSTTGPSAYYKFNAQISASSSFKTMWTYKSSTSSVDQNENSVYADGGVPYTALQPVWTKLGMTTVGNGIYNYSISYSLDGQNYVLVASKQDSYKMSGADIGALNLVSNPNYSADNTADMIPQQLDLNETYIKVNGKLWYWQPQETKKIVVNNTVVWEKTV